MRHIIFLILAMLIALPGRGQDLPKPREIDKEYRKEYRQEVREYNRAERRIAENWDVFLSPIESVPTYVISPGEFRAQAYSNWYADLASPETVWADMLKAAKRKGVIIVTDTGCDTDHPDLQRGKIQGSNYTADPCPDKHGHGTHVLGIAYKIVEPLIHAGFIDVKMAKVLGDRGQGAYGAITTGVQEETAWAQANYLANGRFVVANASWGGGTSVYAPLKTALADSRKKGVSWFFAAGNTGSAVIFPGLLPEVSAVSSLDKTLTISSFSSRGPEVDFTAGGRGIYSTYPGGTYAELSGTSMACPAMAGAGAAAMCFYPSLTAETMPSYLAGIARDLGDEGKDDWYGYGMALVRAILDNPPDDGKKNGGEEGIDCGGPCPPCDTGPPPYRKRTLPVYLKGDWSLSWWRADGKSATAEPEVYDLETVPMVSPAGQKTIYIKEIGFLVDMGSEYVWEAETLRKNTDGALKNTGLGTGNVDAYDAAKWAPLVVEYFSKTKPGFVPQDLVPIHLLAVVDGVEIRFRAEDLVDYKK